MKRCLMLDKEFNFDDDVFIYKEAHYGEIRFRRDNFLSPVISALLSVSV